MRRGSGALVLLCLLLGSCGGDRTAEDGVSDNAGRICREWSQEAERVADPSSARTLTSAERRYARVEAIAERGLKALERLAPDSNDPQAVRRFVRLRRSVLQRGRRELHVRVRNNRGAATPSEFAWLTSSVRQQRQRLASASKAAHRFGASACAGTN
jgi:hypothetical protein